MDMFDSSIGVTFCFLSFSTVSQPKITIIIIIITTTKTHARNGNRLTLKLLMVDEADEIKKKKLSGEMLARSRLALAQASTNV